MHGAFADTLGLRKLQDQRLSGAGIGQPACAAWAPTAYAARVLNMISGRILLVGHTFPHQTSA